MQQFQQARPDLEGCTFSGRHVQKRQGYPLKLHHAEHEYVQRTRRSISSGTHGVSQLRAGCSSAGALRGTLICSHATLASDALLLKLCRRDEEAAGELKHTHRHALTTSVTAVA